MSSTLQFAVHPGEYIEELLTIKNMSQEELASRIGVSPKHVSQMINGKSSISPEIAIAFENVFGTSPNYWQRLQAGYDNFLAKKKIEQEIVRNIDWVKFFDYQSLVAYGVVSPVKNNLDKAAEIFRFFEVKDYESWKRTWSEQAEEIYCRASNQACGSVEEKVIVRLSSWIRIGQIHVEKNTPISFPVFNSTILREKISDIRKLNAITEPDELLNRLSKTLTDAGVVICLLPAQSGMFTYAASYMFRNNSIACIQLSLRGKTHDQLWFTILHEIYHLLNRGNQKGFFIGNHSNEEEEKAADSFAANVLIPADRYSIFSSKEFFTKESIENFSTENMVHPGIVVGRLQHDKKISYRAFNELKIRYEFQ